MGAGKAVRDALIAGSYAELDEKLFAGNTLIAGQYVGLVEKLLAGNLLIAGQYAEVLKVQQVLSQFALRAFLPAGWKSIRIGCYCYCLARRNCLAPWCEKERKELQE